MLGELSTFLAQTTAPAAGEGGFRIDWPTFLFQIANFLVLVFLLRYFLYGRVVKAMDQREKKIASHFEAAEQKEKEAAQSAESLAREEQEFRQQRDGFLAEAREQADARRHELTEEARQEVESQASRWQEDLRRGKQSFLHQMQQRAGEQVCAIARRALADLADEQLERRMAGVLARRLAELPEPDRQALKEALADSAQALVVATAWELPEADRQNVAKAVREQLGGDPRIEYQTAPELTCGIELRAGGHEISWTLEGYVQGIHEQLAEAIDEKIEHALPPSASRKLAEEKPPESPTEEKPPEPPAKEKPGEAKPPEPPAEAKGEPEERPGDE